jgi:peptide deformylase
MALREVLQFPDKRLRRVSQPIGEITDTIRSLASDMLEVMYDEPGIGLAAPQVGEAVRLVVVDTVWREENSERSPLVLINPQIVSAEGELLWTEGCLSVPDFEAEVERFAKLRLQALDLDGHTLEIDAEGLQAVCFQHEIDHLDGVLFLDRISRLKRELYVRRRKKQLRSEARERGSAPLS